jgi:hypothetical protein
LLFSGRRCAEPGGAEKVPAPARAKACALDAAFGLGRVGGDLLDAEFLQSSAELGGALFSGELFGHGPVGIVALKDAVVVAIEAERDAMGGNHGVQGTEIAKGVFGFELKMGGEDLAGGVILKADEGELGAAAFQPIMTAIPRVGL